MVVVDRDLLKIWSLICIVLNHEDLITHPTEEGSPKLDPGPATSIAGHDLHPSQHAKVSSSKIYEYYLGPQEGYPLKEEAC